jgi:pilus assembly protein CpaB
MKAKAMIPLVLGLAIGLVAVKFGIDTVKRSKAASTNSTKIAVVRAAVDIDAFTEITEEMVEEVETSPNAFLPKSEIVEKAEDIIGRVTSTSIPAGMPVLTRMLAEKGVRAGIEGAIEPGFRAVSVKVDEVSAIAYQVLPGDWVDVIVVMEITGADRRKEKVAKVILQRVQVLAVGRSMASGKDGDEKSKRAAKSVTLLVPEQDVPKLHLAQTSGDITLAMRGLGDEPGDDRPAAKISELVADLSGSNEDDDGKKGRLPFWRRSLAYVQQNAAKPTMAPVPVQQPQPEPQPEPVQVATADPHTVVIVRGAQKGGSPRIQRVVFAGPNSHEVLEVQDGSSFAAPSTQKNDKSGKAESTNDASTGPRRPTLQDPGVKRANAAEQADREAAREAAQSNDRSDVAEDTTTESDSKGSE